MKYLKKVSLFVFGIAFCIAILSCAGMGGGSKAPVLATGEWMVYNDRASDGGSSISTLVEAEEVIDGETVTTYSVSGNVTTQFVYGFAGWGIDADEETLERFKTAKALSFKILGDGKRYTIKYKIETVTDYCYHEYTFETEAGKVLTIEVPMMFFMQPSWGTSVRFNPALVTGVEWQTHESWRPGSFQIKMWDFKIHP